MFNVQLLHPNAQPPRRHHQGDAGMDLVTPTDVHLQPGERQTIALGFAAEFPTDLVALVRDRSSMGAKGIHCLAGVIDASYRGEWKVVLLNTSMETQSISAGDRIAQCLLLPFAAPDVEVVDILSDSTRGAGGFGSTGR